MKPSWALVSGEKKYQCCLSNIQYKHVIIINRILSFKIYKELTNMNIVFYSKIQSTAVQSPPTHARRPLLDTWDINTLFSNPIITWKPHCCFLWGKSIVNCTVKPISVKLLRSENQYHLVATLKRNLLFLFFSLPKMGMSGSAPSNKNTSTFATSDNDGD